MKRKPSSVVIIVIQQDANGGAVEVVILARTQGPEKYAKPAEPQKERDRNEKGKTVHCADVRKRRALAITMIDDPDIAKAATNGVTCPEIANGTATIL